MLQNPLGVDRFDAFDVPWQMNIAGHGRSARSSGASTFVLNALDVCSAPVSPFWLDFGLYQRVIVG